MRVRFTLPIGWRESGYSAKGTALICVIVGIVAGCVGIVGQRGTRVYLNRFLFNTLAAKAFASKGHSERQKRCFSYAKGP